MRVEEFLLAARFDAKADDVKRGHGITPSLGQAQGQPEAWGEVPSSLTLTRKYCSG
jgi:hypothetical protein